MCSNQKGYTLVEVIISIAVSVLVIGALTFATISSLRNAQLAKRQSQATKYAQQGLEKVRSFRDRDGAVATNFPAQPTNFSGLWTIYMSSDTGNCPAGICYFRISNETTLTQGLASTANEDLEGGTFKRQIQVVDQDICGSGATQTSQCYTKEKQVTSLVRWTDFAGDHESKLTTVLRKL